MKLELKHWSAYLPYELRIQLGDGEIKTVIAIKDWVGWCVTYKSKHGETNIGLNSAKPILRPLSDLATFIIHNGIEFYPLEWIAQELDYDLYSLEYYREHTLRIPYEILSKLLEWNFDIFGLIPHDLAVDINTLNK